jgi:adenylosuccinate synthase
MSIEVIAGVNWGDEGKGRMVDYLAQDADVVVRYQGGNNAGHTVVNDRGTFKLHLIPSGIFSPNAVNVLGPGMVIDLEGLDAELRELEAHGVSPLNVKISERATICFPFNRDEDAWEEARLAADAQRPFGSTKRGIAPAYGDRYVKKAIQVGELLHPAWLKERLKHLVDWKNLIAQGVYGKDEAVSFDATWDWAMTYAERLAPRICDVSELLEAAARAKKKLLFEAQLGALKDIDFGIYPYTSSSHTLAAFAPIGGGLLNWAPDRVIGVLKAFSTCVGEGPFVTEIEDSAVAQALRETAMEYGAATGRPRRIGYFDALATRYGTWLQGATELALTKLDCLTGIDPLPICTHYDYRSQSIVRFPLNAILEECWPVYIEMPGWQEDISEARRFADLPAAAQAYVAKIEELVGRGIRYVSVGARREYLIDRGRA